MSERGGIVVLDFGGQYTQLIARRIREQQVFSAILPCTAGIEQIRKFEPVGIVLSGGPNSVYDPGAPPCDTGILSMGLPVLGICYGLQWMTHNLGGRVERADRREYGRAELFVKDGSALFAAPPEKDLEWSEQAIEGCARFLQRVYRLVSKHAERLRTVQVKSGAATSLDSATPKEKALLRKAHQVLRRVTHDFETRWHFNSATALLMELVNEIQAQEPLEEGVRPEIAKEVFELMTLMLNPMVPHLAEELWEILGHKHDSLAHAAWPKFVSELAAEDQVEIVVQLNGRVKERMLVEAGLDKEALQKRVMSDPKVAQLLNGQRLLKAIVVPDKLVNLVVE